MIGKLEFDLNDPNDVGDWKLYCKTPGLAIVLSDVAQMLRANMKYDQGKSATDLYTEFWELCQEQNIDPWDV